MEWMNYHHLLYFWIAAREGSVTAAAEESVSDQIGDLHD